MTGTGLYNTHIATPEGADLAYVYGGGAGEEGDHIHEPRR
jgi:hypothetical protein